MSHGDFISWLKDHFNRLSNEVFNGLQGGEEAVVNLEAEDTLYLRWNQTRVRQNTSVQQYIFALRMQNNGRTTELSRTLTGDFNVDQKLVSELLQSARQEIRMLPIDPQQTEIKNNGESHAEFRGHLLPAASVIRSVAEMAEGQDLAGLYAGGPVISANRNSKGQDHWFATESFFMDYSLYNGKNAVKGVYAGPEWKAKEWEEHLHRSKTQLNLLQRPLQNIKKGSYRTYFGPAATSELMSILSWGALSSAAWKQGQCPFRQLAEGTKKLSPLITLQENFQLGLAPSFNALGEVSKNQVPLIENGNFKQLLTSARTAKEYKLQANGANEQEGLRSPELKGGTLSENDILKELGTGLYLSNLHYLSWSDLQSARVTGMTRYACFWVEDGEIVGPIKDLRFDESLYEGWGSKLVALTEKSEIDPSVMTYGARGLGGKKCPGLIIDGWTFTL